MLNLGPIVEGEDGDRSRSAPCPTLVATAQPVGGASDMNGLPYKIAFQLLPVGPDRIGALGLPDKHLILGCLIQDGNAIIIQTDERREMPRLFRQSSAR